MPGDLKISELPALAGSLVEATDPVALADISASETKKVTVKDLIQRGFSFVDDGSIPSSKLSAAWSISDGAVVTAKLADHSVTGRKLADNSSLSVVTGFPAAGEFVGQIVLDLTTNTAQVWGGTGWLTWTTNGGVNKLTPYSDGVVSTSPMATGDTVELRAGLVPTTAKAQFLAGPTTAGGAVTHRAITGPDLPTATSTSQGAVVVNGDGLRISAGGVLGIDNDVTASSTTTYGVVTYNAKGLVTGGRALTALDLPAAASGSIGAMSPGPEFTVSATGELRHLNSITAGTGVKFTYDAQGHITGTAPLLAADIPDIPAEKLTSGTLPIGRIADRSITADKLADYAVSFIQESTPPATNIHHNGQLWLTESTGALRMWNGNSWFPIGSGRLTAENLRYCGVFDATTSKITGITQFGTTAGFKIGDALPVATDAETGVYFVCSVPGNAVSVATGITFDAGDWILCNGNTAGWVRIDTLSGAGGGGGVGGGTDHLDGLLDVTLTNPKPGDVLHFTAAGQWVNVAFTDAGTYA
jgi:hypothetical protein